jgi:hypothetical protein
VRVDQWLKGINEFLAVVVFQCVPNFFYAPAPDETFHILHPSLIDSLVEQVTSILIDYVLVEGQPLTHQVAVLRFFLGG